MLSSGSFPRSSSGRTADSGSAYLGSNPSLGTKENGLSQDNPFSLVWCLTDSNEEGVGKLEFPAQENTKNRRFLEARNERSRS